MAYSENFGPNTGSKDLEVGKCQGYDIVPL